MTAAEWIAAFARELEVPPPDQELFEAILALAGDAAHASERVAAPVACWLGAASGKPVDELRDVASRISGRGSAQLP